MMISLLDGVLFSTYFILLFLSIFWLLVLFTESDLKRSKKHNTPFFSVIVPAYNEEESIVATLTSLVNLDYPADKIEIIVVNDGSKDKTKEYVTEFIRTHPARKIILRNQDNAGKARAMNEGLKVAQGEFFACLDADSFVHPAALQEMLPYFENRTVAAVCPLLKVKSPENVLQKVQWCEYIINMFYKLLNARLDCIHVTPGPFSIYRTEVIKNIGGYDENTITEDLEIAIRLQKYHYKIVQTFDAIVETTAPKTWKHLFTQRVRWYKGSVDNSLQYRKLMFNAKYGDFGFLRMPTILLSGVIAIILMATLMREAFMKLWEWFTALNAIHFDVLTLLANLEFRFNFLSLPFFKLFIATTLLGISFFVMIYSYKLVKEKITNYGRTWMSLTTYLLIYSFFLAIVWIYIAFLFVSRKKNSWS
ncbi:MAG: glycosyltransferase [Nanoarchaeota archaeon]|nr:glycosyltransferase [Nanoarchaeota archaeon]